MARAVGAVAVGVALILAGCSGGGGSVATRFGDAPACPLLAQLALTGQKVATADVSDPTSFDATLKAAVKKYVSTAKKLRAAVPDHLRPDVERMIAAAQHEHFADATTQRAAIDSYARSNCKTN